MSELRTEIEVGNVTKLDVVIVTLEIMGGAIVITIAVNLIGYWIAKLISGLKD